MLCDVASDAQTIVAIVVAGVVGPGLGYFAAARSDRRRFRHERELGASDDLRRMLDDVEASLDELRAVCAGLRIEASQDLGNHAKLSPEVRAAADASQRCHALVARLSMRPHADEELTRHAYAAASSMNDAVRSVGLAMFAHSAGDYKHEVEQTTAIADAIERANEHIAAFEMHARAALGRLVAPGVPEAGGLMARLRAERESAYRGLF
jgi:hypothetical protein